MPSWKRLKRTTEGTSGPVEGVCSGHGSESPQVHPTSSWGKGFDGHGRRQLNLCHCVLTILCQEYTSTVVAALLLCACSWDSLHSLMGGGEV